MKIILALVLLITTGPVFGQVVAIQLEKEDILYVGFYNPATVAVENCKSKNITLVTDNGKTKKDLDHPGLYSIWPAKTGIAHIKIIKRGKKVVGEMTFSVRRVPLTQSLSGYSTGEIPAKIVATAIAPVAIVEGLQIDARAQIVSFTIVVLRDGKEIFRRTLQDSTGTRFDDVSRQFFRNLKNGDKLIIDDIISMDFAGRRPLPPMHFTIINAEELRDLPEYGKPHLVIDPVTGNESWVK